MSASPRTSTDRHFDSLSDANILQETLEQEDDEHPLESFLDAYDSDQSDDNASLLSDDTSDVEDEPDDVPLKIKVVEAGLCDAARPSEQNQELLFRELMQNHQKRLYRFVIRYIDHPDDAADITQQAFVEAARTIASFRGDSKLSTWLYGIAMNMVRNYLSRAPHRVYRFESDEILGGLPCGELDPSDSLAQRELLTLVEYAFSGLPPEMSQVLSLVAIDEISYQEAADMLSIPLGTVRSRVSRARAVLRTHFQEAGIALKF